MPAEPYYHSQTFFTLVIYLMIATMTFKVFTLLVFLFALLGFSGVSQAQDYGCIMSPKKCNINGKRNDPDLSPQIPLNEYRRNKLSRLEEFLRNKRNRFVDDVMLNEE